MYAKLSALALTIATLAAPAMSQSFSPAPNTFTLSGPLTLQQSIIIVCNVTVGVSVNSSGVATVTSRSFSPGDPAFCGSVVQAFGTWTLTPDTPTQVTAGVGASSILGQCFGNAVGTWSNASSTLSFAGASVPGIPGACTVTGTLTSSDPNVQIP